MSPAQLQRLLQDAVAHHRAGRLDRAEALYRRVCASAPRNFDAVQLSGVVALQQGRAAEAAELLDRACRLNPSSAVAVMRHALALSALGRIPEAENRLREAIRLDGALVEAWDNLAYSLKTQNRLPEALECHARAVALKPDYAAGWYNYGLSLSLAGRVTEALECHQRALTADPAYAKAHYGRAQALQQSFRMREAVESYDRYLALEPGNHEARSYRLFALNYLEDVTPDRLFSQHVAFGRAVGETPVPDFAHEADPARRLRVAILSPDLHTHSCAYFIEPLVAHLDPAAFEIYLYHDHFREDDVSARLRRHAAVWRSTVALPGPILEQTIRADRPDIVIDLAGHTGMTNRLPLFARHLAPVQVTYLGYPNTTGLPAMGYRFTDEIADPAGDSDDFATEKLVRFAPTAWAYRPPEDAPPVSPLPGAAPGTPLTFGCFNNPGKISDSTLQWWARILQSVPASRLLLKARGLGDAGTRERHLARFDALGLPRDRVDLVERTARADQHLAVYHRVDIALDTHPYNGTTTTCEALWMGVPVISLRGDRHAARVGASLLIAAGHPEWIAGSADEYVRLAVNLASDRGRLAALRAGLRDDLRRGTLLDHAGQAARFGDALRACWRDWCAPRRAGATMHAAETLCA
ncbi:MAG TPA: tetratricopeptide repeat protein [Candidatus Didemnitutus sp.]|jgi:predicted O-linked N-acetylglucosamine transferase (SPINDLY family)